MKELNSNMGLNFISFYGYHAPNKDKENSFINENSYTLFYDKKTKGVYKAEAKNIRSSTFLLLFLIGYPTMNFFPNELIPYEHHLIFIGICLMTILLSMVAGTYFIYGFNKDLRRITLSKDDWNYYLEKGNKLYLIQIAVMTTLLLFAISCFIFLYMYQSKWWLFGGIGTSFIVGGSIPLFSKTRYLLYKNRVDVHLNNDEAMENDDIISY